MTTWTIFGTRGNGANGPVASTAYTGPLVQHIHFRVRAANGAQLYLQGYGYWRADVNQTAAPAFAAWQVTGAGAAGTYLGSASNVTLAGGVAGQWNYVNLPVPIPLAPGIEYAAVYGAPNNFSQTLSQFGVAPQPYAAGITSGPIFAYSSSGGSAPDAFGNTQDGFSTATSDPTAQMGATANSDYNAFVDIVITDTPPANPTYRMYPNMPVLTGSVVPTTSTAYMPLGRQFSISSTFAPNGVTLLKGWHYSPPTSASLPTRCGFFDVASQTEIAALSMLSPSWLLPGGGAATAGAGWIYVDYSGLNYTLSPGVQYKWCRGSTNNASAWFPVVTGYFTTGTGSNGEQASPLVYPNSASATPAQDSWNAGTVWGWPGTATSSESNGADVEVSAPLQPSGSSGTAPIMSNAAGDVYGWVWERNWLKRRSAA